MLTIAYTTARLEPQFQWFADSLDHETQGDYDGINVVVVDFHAEERSLKGLAHCPITHVTPKPTVWQGASRLTSRDYFAASNARNTALCHALDGWIAYVDDLSVLLPGWLKCVREAMEGGHIVLGAFKKMLALEVQDGVVLSYRDHPQGVDSRWGIGNDLRPVPVPGSALFGSSVAMPVEALLKINGWDEDCDSMSGEDYICGLMLERNGYRLMYDRRMVTYESEERHHQEAPFLRIIKKPPGAKVDSSHAMLNMVLTGGRTRAPNYADMRELRSIVLAGNPFPPVGIPENDWRDGQPLREM